MRNETTGRFQPTHGLRDIRRPTYAAWIEMRRRCRDPRRPEYPRYGGRGITICERWSSFENFFEDMGEKPHRLTLERIDNNGNYEPGNCKWATYSEQNLNRRMPWQVPKDVADAIVADKGSDRALAKKYDVHYSTVNKIRNRAA
jgi:hypothetical protein